MFLDAERKNKQTEPSKQKKKHIVLDAVRETAS